MSKKTVLMGICLLLMIGLVLFARGEKETAAGADTEKRLEYDVYFDTDTVQRWMNNPTDIVTPYVEDKFNLYIRDIYWRSGMMTEERLSTFIATNTLPHVFVAGRNTMMLARESALELQDLIPKHMPYYWNNVLDEKWKRDDCTMRDGTIFWLYKKRNLGLSDEELLNPYDNWLGLSPIIREDILADLGYSFTPIKEIQETCRKEGRAPTLDDWKIEPLPYSDPYTFAEFLKKIKDGNYKDANGHPVFPISLRWGIQILATSFDWGGIWKYYPEKDECYAGLGAKDSKNFLKWWWQMYRDGLIDPDYVSQSPQQLQDKIAAGRAAMTIYVADPKSSQDALLGHNSDWYLRPMPLPYVSLDPDKHGYYEKVKPGHWTMFINKKVDMNLATRLMEMWDWLNTEEGQKVLCFGPPNAGITETVDGTLFFKEPIMSQVLAEERDAPGGIEELGLVGTNAFLHQTGHSWSLIGNCSAAPESFDVGIQYSLPPRPDVLAMGRRRFSAPSFAYGKCTADAEGEAAASVWGYWNATFKYNEISRILNAKDENEFEELFQWVIKQNESEGRFTEAQEYMLENVFRSQGCKPSTDCSYSISHEWYW